VIDPPQCLRAWQVTSYPVVEAELSLLSEEHDCGRSELLADRSGLEDAVRGHRYLVVKVCKAVSLGQHDLTVFDAIPGIFCRGNSAETNRSIVGIASLGVADAPLQSTLMRRKPV
jgi:hypothetical protein